LVWDGEAPGFADENEANAILGAIMGRYNEILRQIDHDDFNPIFWSHNGTLIAVDWAEGFLHAIVQAWDRLLKSKRDGQLLIPILALCGDENGKSLTPDEEEGFMEKAAELIPARVTAIAAYWRGKGPTQILMPLTSGSSTKRTPTKVGRRSVPLRLKKCCGKAA
jgi:uncharacterized protein